MNVRHGTEELQSIERVKAQGIMLRITCAALHRHDFVSSKIDLSVNISAV